MKKSVFFTFTFLMTCFLKSSLFADYWSFDKDHSSVAFKTEHLAISEISGRFNDFYAWIEIDEENFENSKIEIRAQVSSIDTGLKARDSHLLSEDFFHSKVYPDITFSTDYIRRIEGEKFELRGALRIKDVTKTVSIELNHRGYVKDHWGNQRAGFHLIGEISRFDFDLDWGDMLRDGGLIIGETITIECNLEVIKQNDDRFLLST